MVMRSFENQIRDSITTMEITAQNSEYDQEILHSQTADDPVRLSFTQALHDTKWKVLQLACLLALA